MPDMKAVTDMIGKALETMEGHGVDIKTLQDNVEKMTKQVIKLQSANEQLIAAGAGSNDIGGFKDIDTAKDFLKMAAAIVSKDTAVLKDLTEGTDSEGGFLVPGTSVPTLIRLIESYGLIRKMATVIPMTQNTTTWPKLVNGLNIFWMDEGQIISQTQPEFGDLVLNTKKMGAIVPVTSELVEDSTIAIANLLATLFSESVAEEEDRVGFVGNVNAATPDPFNGILWHPDNVVVSMDAGKDSFNDVTADDLLDMTDAVVTPALQRSGYQLNRTVMNIVRKLKDTTGNYIYDKPSGTQPGTIWGYPYTLVETMPNAKSSAPDTPFISFGDLRQLYMGDRRRMTIAQSIHHGFAQDKIFLRMTERIAYNMAKGKHIAVLKTAS